jgi:hypothetical protein
LLYRVQPRITLSDLNGHTMHVTGGLLQARIATSSGLLPTMFIARVRLQESVQRHFGRAEATSNSPQSELAGRE